MKKLTLLILLLSFIGVGFAQSPFQAHYGFISKDSSVFEDASTFEDTIYYTGQTATDTLLWMGANSVTKAVYLDTTETSSFALFMELEPIDSFMTDIVNGELKWYYEEDGKIKFKHGWATNISDRYQQLMAGIEIGLLYTWDNSKEIRELKTQNRALLAIVIIMLVFGAFSRLFKR